MTKITITLTPEQAERVAPLFLKVRRENWPSLFATGTIAGAAIIGQLLQQDVDDDPTVEFAYLAPDVALEVYNVLRKRKL